MSGHRNEPSNFTELAHYFGVPPLLVYPFVALLWTLALASGLVAFLVTRPLQWLAGAAREIARPSG